MDCSSIKERKARTFRHCEICGQAIARGMTYTNVKGLWEGSWQNWGAHTPCFKIHDGKGGGEIHQLGPRDLLEAAEAAGQLAPLLLYYRVPEVDDWRFQQFPPKEGWYAFYSGIFERARAQLAAIYLPGAPEEIKPEALEAKIPLPEFLKGPEPCRKCDGAIADQRVRVSKASSDGGEGVYHGECFGQMVSAKRFRRWTMEIVVERVPVLAPRAVPC